jgi:hypothetical protein
MDGDLATNQADQLRIQPGYYRHYKGGIAKVINEAKNSETGEVYVAYYHKERETGNIVLWVRPKAMFFEHIVFKGRKLPRFDYLGDDMAEIERATQSSS